MWIIRWHLIDTSDYNFIARELKKSSFVPRKIPSILFIKASILHICQKKSWRKIASELSTNHIYLFNFYQNFKNSSSLKIILHRFIEKRILLYIEEKKTFDTHFLDNNKEIIKLTKDML
ncbi:hypothetical protein HGA92_00180 [Candidatus Gracilibacteria bacterium]|nr:hypothetical protein [Candidatus Gracilibacteria bacterium]NUJ98972.1 hypothetical protein [Candidatus Gracilibacteria bacterium]